MIISMPLASENERAVIYFRALFFTHVAKFIQKGKDLKIAIN
jgi:hypothetical protein